MSTNVTLEPGTCWWHDQPSCAEWTAEDNARYDAWYDACEDVRYNGTASDDSCGPCETRLFVFKTCAPETMHEWLACVLYSLVGFELTFTIFSGLAEVLRGFKMRGHAMRYLLELIPHHGVLSQNHQDTFGLLPKFSLNRVGNIVAWNRMRIVLQTWDSNSFKQEQKRAAFALLVLFAVLVAQIYVWFMTSDLDGHSIVGFISRTIESFSKELLPRRFHYADLIDSPALTSLSLKMLLLQVLGSGLIFRIVWAGANATKLFEYELPHLLTLIKAELQQAALPKVRPLWYSSGVELEVWCKLEDATIETLRRHLIKHQLHETVARYAVRSWFGCMHVLLSLRSLPPAED
jgi:hypothetical protein